MNSIRFILRWIRFHFKYKRHFSKTLGIPTLCSNINHPYHESKFEQKTCEVLSAFFNKRDILCPTNHKYETKFDFIIKNIAIVEPHGIWTSESGNNSYLEYYKQRREQADRISDLKDLPLVVLTNLSDLNTLKNSLGSDKNYIRGFLEISKTLLEKYNINSPPNQQESIFTVVNIWLVVLLILSILFNFYLLNN